MIEGEARRARVVFNSEPGRVSGNVETGARRRVHGVPRHRSRGAFGRNYTEGISAIEELARKIQALHALTDLDRGITLNVGLVAAGKASTPWLPGPRARSICATSIRPTATTQWRGSAPSSSAARARHEGRAPPSGANSCRWRRRVHQAAV